MYDIASRFNCSSKAKYFISYKKPKHVIEKYMFQVELIAQLHTTMHASSEGHTCYIFQHIGSVSEGATEKSFGVPCDPLFVEAWEMCKIGGFDAINNFVIAKVDLFFQEKPVRVRRQPKRLTY